MHITIRRAALAVAALTVTAGSLTACGGDDSSSSSSSPSSPSSSASSASDTASSASASGSADADGSGDSGDSTGTSDEAQDSPDDTSVGDFCATYADYITEFTKVSAGGADSNIVPTIKKYAEELEKTGTPSGIPDQARHGFELSIDAAASLDDDATTEDMMSAGASYSADDQADAQAFATYVQKTCPDLLKGLTPTDGAS